MCPAGTPTACPSRTAIQKQGVKRNEMPVPEFRDKCRAFALEQLDKPAHRLQTAGRHGRVGRIPIVTLKPEFEAAEVKVFGAMAKKGLHLSGPEAHLLVPHLRDRPGRGRGGVCRRSRAPPSIVKFQVHDDKGKLTPMYGDLVQGLLRHLDHHHLDAARQPGHLPEPPAVSMRWSRPAARSTSSPASWPRAFMKESRHRKL